MVLKNPQAAKQAARVANECRERVKRAVKMLGEMYYFFGAEHARSAMLDIQDAVKECRFKEISSNDVFRWFESKEKVDNNE